MLYPDRVGCLAVVCRASLAHAVTERDLQALEAALERAAQTGLPEEDTAEGRYGSWVAAAPHPGAEEG